MSEDEALDGILKSLYKEVIPDCSTFKRPKTIVTQLLSTCTKQAETESMLIKAMKDVDSLFATMFQDVQYAGLFCDGMKDIDTPNTLKVYFVFSLPFDNDLNVTESCGDLPLTATYVNMWSEQPCAELLPPSHKHYAACSSISNFFHYTYTGYIWRTYYYILASSRVLQWFDNIVTTAVGNLFIAQNSLFHRWFYARESLFYDVGVEELGAVNMDTYKRYKGNSWNTYLNVRSESGLSVDIQMVPVINYHNKFLVPKPLAENANAWRQSNYKREKELTKDSDAVLKTMRFLIKFCRMQGPMWDDLTSYCLKTVVLQYLRNNPWLSKDFTLLFMGCLRDEFPECLARRAIPYFFDADHNLLAHMDVQTVEVIRERLDRILKDVQRNHPLTLKKYFTMVECNTETIDGSEPTYCSVM